MTKTLSSILISLVFFMFLSCENDVNSKNINDLDSEVSDLDQVEESFDEEWTVYWGFGESVQNDLGKSVAVSKDGSIFVAGDNIEDSDESENPENNPTPFFLTKISPDGTIMWSVLNGSIGMVIEGKTIATDSRNNCFVVSNRNDYLLITKFNSAGKIELSRPFDKKFIIQSIAIDKSGNIFVGGFNNTSKKPYLMKTDGEGIKLWEKEWDEENHFMVESVAVDVSGDVYVVGRTEDDPDSDGGGDRSESFIVKFDGNGKKLWSKNWGVPKKWTIGNSIFVDIDGSIFVSGMTSGTFEENISAGDTDIFVTKFNPGSDIEWTKQFGTDAWDSGYSMTVDGKGHVVVTGSASNSEYCKNKGCRESFLISVFDYDGNNKYSKEWSNGEQSNIFSISSDMKGNVFFTGHNENSDNEGSVFLTRFSLNGSDTEIVDNENNDENFEIDEENCRQPNGGISNFAIVTYEEDKCANPGERTFKMLHLVEPKEHPITDHENHEMICTMTIDSIVGGEIENFSADATIPESDYYYVSEKQKYTDISGTSEGEKCWDAERYTIRFNGYDKEMFIDSMIGKKITFYTIWSYWGMAKVAAVSHEDGTWIALNNVSAEKFGLKPETTINKTGMLECTTLCVYGMGYNGNDIRNYTIQPPVMFSIDGVGGFVLTRNGESVVSEGFEYYSDFSVAISGKDPDGIFTVEADYDPLPSPTGQSYFSILNIGALK